MFEQYYFSMPQKGALTARQEQVLSFIKERLRQSGFAPTIQEIAANFGFKSTNSAREHLRLIEKKGFLRKEPGRYRALSVPHTCLEEMKPIRVPVLGRVAAGPPIVAIQDANKVLDVPAGLFRGGGLFALRVRGDSMSGAGILSGDLAVLDRKPEISEGNIGAVVIGDEATLKRVYRKPDGLVLRADNPAFSDIKIPAADSDSVRVIGELVGIIRTL